MCTPETSPVSVPANREMPLLTAPGQLSSTAAAAADDKVSDLAIGGVSMQLTAPAEVSLNSTNRSRGSIPTKEGEERPCSTTFGKMCRKR